MMSQAHILYKVLFRFLLLTLSNPNWYFDHYKTKNVPRNHHICISVLNTLLYKTFLYKKNKNKKTLTPFPKFTA